MITMGKLICFLGLLGLALGQIFTTGSMVRDLYSVSPCGSAQECHSQYVRNIGRCLPGGGIDRHENFCGDAIDPAYFAVKGDWQTRDQKFSEIANEEEQKLSPEVLQAKQQHIREAIKNKFQINQAKIYIAVSLFILSLILPFISLLADFYLAYKARKLLLAGQTPSALITLGLCVFFALPIACFGMILSSGFSHFDLYQTIWVSVIFLFLAALTYFIAKAIGVEFRKFREMVRASRKIKMQGVENAGRPS